MQYLCLIYYDEKAFGGWPQASRDAIRSEAEALVLGLIRERKFAGGEALESTRAAVTLRNRHGDVVVTDGPFAETKEQLAGVLLIDAANLDEAIGVAARVPAARFGSVEVRPVRTLS